MVSVPCGVTRNQDARGGQDTHRMESAGSNQTQPAIIQAGDGLLDISATRIAKYCLYHLFVYNIETIYKDSFAFTCSFPFSFAGVV